MFPKPYTKEYILDKILWYKDKISIDTVDNLIVKIRKKINNNRATNYYRGEGKPQGNVLILHKVGSLFMRRGSPLFRRHQSNWKVYSMINVFNDLGYSVDVFPYNDTSVTPKSFDKYDVLFGEGENFSRFATSFSEDTSKIYYAPVMHWKQRNQAEIERLERVTKRRGVDLDPKRQIAEQKYAKIADAIINLGDQYTKQTFKDSTSKNTSIHTVRNASFDFLDADLNAKDYERARTNFLWFGGTGLVLKGLDLVLEAFAEMPEYDLYVCGPLESEPEFTEEYSEELYETDNIHPVGWVHVQSEEFEEVTDRCGHLIYPSASEATLPGAVLNTMHRGVIPIVTKECIADAEDWGFVLPDASIETIQEYVHKAADRSSEEIADQSRRAYEKVKRDYSKECYKKDLEDALRTILDEQAGSDTHQ